MKLINWINKNKHGIIRFMFIIPILLVATISITHVTDWYNLSNPISWAIFLSIAVEVAAMSALAAATVGIRGGVWFVFIIVTLIQMIGNIYYSYNKINIYSDEFNSWVELTTPLLDIFGWEINDNIIHKRFLSFISGGLLPIISLTCLHFFISYKRTDDMINEKTKHNNTQNLVPEISANDYDNKNKKTGFIGWLKN
jgi:hypothetical protein